MKATSIERELAENGRCVIRTVGNSMEPLLREYETTVLLKKPCPPLRRGDVVLFYRESKEQDELILHRIVAVSEGEYRIRGDNCLYTEQIPFERILGVMTGFMNGPDFIDCESDRHYRLYVKTLGLRYAVRFIVSLPGRAARRLIRIVSGR